MMSQFLGRIMLSVGYARHYLSLYLYTDTLLFSETAVVKAECIVASARSYSDKTGGEPYHRNHQYHMITNCFHDNTNDTLVARCQRPDTHALADRVPVTSQLTGYTYWNKPCAVCNDDAEDLMEWTPVVLIKTMIPYFSKSLIRIPYPDTYELLFQLLSAQRFADVIYTRPASISANDQECIREDSLGANQVVCSNTLSEEDWLSEPCNQLYSPVRDRTAYNFRNIFCWACRTSIQMNVNNPSCSVKEGFKANPGYLTALLNYKSEPETTALHEVKRLVGEGNCDCAMMYDPYLVITLLHNAKTPLQNTIILIAVKLIIFI